MPILFSIVLLVLGSITIWQGLRLLAGQENPQIDNEAAQSNLEAPSPQATQAPANQATEMPELVEAVSESPISEPTIRADTLQIDLPVNLVEITATNAQLIEEIARIGDGKIAIFDSEGGGGFEASLPVDRIGQALLSPDGTILLMYGSPKKDKVL